MILMLEIQNLLFDMIFLSKVLKIFRQKPV